MAKRGVPVLGRTNKKSSRTLYIACEEMNFFWSGQEVEHFVDMWEQGESIANIAAHFNRDPDEVGLLIIDQAKQNLIKPRLTGKGRKNDYLCKPGNAL